MTSILLCEYDDYALKVLVPPYMLLCLYNREAVYTAAGVYIKTIQLAINRVYWCTDIFHIMQSLLVDTAVNVPKAWQYRSIMEYFLYETHCKYHGSIPSVYSLRISYQWYDLSLLWRDLQFFTIIMHTVPTMLLFTVVIYQPIYFYPLG